MKKKKLANRISKEDREMVFWKGQKVLVISPHPDDEVMGCGGTLAKAKSLGAEVYVLIVSVSDLRFYEKRGVVRGEERMNEIDKVARILKWDDYEISYVDHKKHMKMDVMPRFDLIAEFESEARLSLDRLKPDIVMIPAVSYNQDHEAVFKAAFTALRVHAGGFKHTPDRVLVYDSPTLSWNYAGNEFHPNFYVDISKYIDLKMKAMQAYSSQSRHPNDPCSHSSIEEIARNRGREVGREYCEAFMLYRDVV